jgi:hypothetical protein
MIKFYILLIIVIFIFYFYKKNNYKNGYTNYNHYRNTCNSSNHHEKPKWPQNSNLIYKHNYNGTWYYNKNNIKHIHDYPFGNKLPNYFYNLINKNTYIINIPEHYAFGNKLSSYFYHLTIAYINNKNCVINNIDNINNKLIKLLIPKISIITNNCPYYLINNLNNIKGINKPSFWEHKQYFKYIHPINKKNCIFNKDTSYTKDCIIHFRCSDIPFVKHQQYHLLKFNWFLKSIKICLKKIKINKIYILNCSDHLSNNNNNKKKCKEWSKLLGIFLEYNLNINFEIMCNNIKDDIFYMLNSKCLISSGGSLSFTLGMLTDNIFIYPTNSTDSKNLNCSLTPIRDNSICLKKDFIKHKDIKDYNKLNNNLLYG